LDTTGERLRARRESLKLTQAQVSERLAAIGLKYSQARLSRLERGRNAPTAELLAGLAYVLYTSVAELECPADRPGHRTHDIVPVVLEASDVVWLLDQLPSSQRAEFLSMILL
jgi:transcriptional regulator with XRE-family HTH domain